MHILTATRSTKQIMNGQSTRLLSIQDVGVCVQHSLYTCLYTAQRTDTV